MYLHKSKCGYLRKNGKISYGIDGYKSDKYGRNNGIEVKTNVAYWRKANAIHSWFVNNVQNGKDDCEEYEVSEGQLHELYDICKDIITKADGLKLSIPKKYWDKDWYKDMDKEIFFNSKNLKKMFKSGIFNYVFDNRELKDYIVDKLPPCKGFFFGSTDIDGNYLYDIVKTVFMLDDLFKTLEVENKNKEYPALYYRASW